MPLREGEYPPKKIIFKFFFSLKLLKNYTRKILVIHFFF